jgi:hypothetical protein
MAYFYRKGGLGIHPKYLHYGVSPGIKYAFAGKKTYFKERKRYKKANGCERRGTLWKMNLFP